MLVLVHLRKLKRRLFDVHLLRGTKKWQSRWGPPWVNYSVIHQKILWKKEAFIYHHNKYSAAHFRGLVQHDYALEKLWFMMILLIDNHFLLVEPFWHVLTCFATAHKQIIDFWNYCSPAEILKWIGSFKFWLLLFLTFSLEVRKKSVGYLQPQKLSRPLRTTLVTDCQKKPLKLLHHHWNLTFQIVSKIN